MIKICTLNFVKEFTSARELAKDVNDLLNDFEHFREVDLVALVECVIRS